MKDDIEKYTGRLLRDLEGQAAPTRETKSRRMQLLVKRSTAEGLEAAAAEEGISMNALVNRLIEEYLQGREAE